MKCAYCQETGAYFCWRCISTPSNDQAIVKVKPGKVTKPIPTGQGYTIPLRNWS